MQEWDSEANAVIERTAAFHSDGRRDPSLHGAAPESTSDLRTDVFLLGMEVYALVLGEPAFGNPLDHDRRRAGAVVPPRLLDPTLPARVDHALMAALSADPAARPPDAASLLSLWRGARRHSADLAASVRSVAARKAPGTRFPSTRWSVVLCAGAGHTHALQALCTAYWEPLYTFARRQGCTAAQAEDAVQGFFADILSRNDLGAVRTDRGRFRSWMRTAMKRWLLKGWRAERTAKRGAGAAPVPLDARDAEGRLQHEPAGGATPEELFDRDWAAQVFARARQRVAEDYRGRGQGAVFDVLGPCLTDALDPSYAELAAQLGITQGALKVAVHRLRRRYGTAVRAEIADTVDEPASIEAEIRDLRRILEGDR